MSMCRARAAKQAREALIAKIATAFRKHRRINPTKMAREALRIVRDSGFVVSGRGAVGESNPKAKLSKRQVAAIRSSTRKGAVLAAHYRVHPHTIWRIRRGDLWPTD
jgi:hypothetical protein